MRVAPIGAFFAYAPEALDRYVRASTRLTHSDPRALVGAMAVARLTAWCVRRESRERMELKELVALLRSLGEGDPEWRTIVDQLAEAARGDLSVEAFADRLGLERGVSGYVYHTVPIAT
jgi:ADP-ribosylglycohydrolase